MNALTQNGFDEYFGKVMPLAVAISLMKTFLAEEIATEVVTHVEKSDRRSLTKGEEKIIQRAADAAVATLNPDVFKIDANWSPKSSEEVKEKMIDLKLDTNFKRAIVDSVLRLFREPQARLGSEFD